MFCDHRRPLTIHVVVVPSAEEKAKVPERVRPPGALRAIRSVRNKSRQRRVPSTLAAGTYRTISDRRQP